MASPSSKPPDPSLNIDMDILHLTVRFSASIADLPLDISSPSTTTAAGLKQLIRTHLPNGLSTHRLRLIYAGRGLEDTTSLAVSLKLKKQQALQPQLLPRSLLPPSALPAKGIDEVNNGFTTDIESASTSTKEKGKAPVRDAQPQSQQPRIYVHCSIGDIILSKDELASEATVTSTISVQRQRQQREEERRKWLFASGVDLQAQEAEEEKEKEEEQRQQRQQQQQQGSSTTPAPRGFDRLLSTGFTAAEVSALRSQFLAVLSVSRTPDTMPTGSELRELEDRWMDEGSSVGGGSGIGGGGSIGDGGGDDDGSFGAGSRGAIDDMLWGAVMGFFWPVGCAMWLRREEGVWSWRKGLAIFVGVIVNAAFGSVRVVG